MNTKSGIFTSGEATSENIAFGVRRKSNKKRFYTEIVKFSISFMFKNYNISVYSNAFAFRTETQLFPKLFCFKLDASSVFTGYAIGCKHSLQLKNRLKLHLKKQISRNLIRKND